MDNFVSMHELLNKITGLSIVHSPDLLNTLVISLFEPFESLLKLDELISEDLILLGELSVQILGFSDLHLESFKFQLAKCCRGNIYCYWR